MSRARSIHSETPVDAAHDLTRIKGEMGFGGEIDKAHAGVEAQSRFVVGADRGDQAADARPVDGVAGQGEHSAAGPLRLRIGGDKGADMRLVLPEADGLPADDPALRLGDDRAQDIGAGDVVIQHSVNRFGGLMGGGAAKGDDAVQDLRHGLGIGGGCVADDHAAKSDLA